MKTLIGITAILMWGSLALLGAKTSALPPFQLLFMCFSISFLLMLVKRKLTNKPLFVLSKMPKAHWLIGVCALFGYHLFYFIALNKAPVIEVSLIAYLWPMLLGLLISKGRNFYISIIGGSIGFFGVSLIILGENNFSLNEEYLMGYLLAFCCALIWSTYSWFLSTANNDVDDIGWLSLGVAGFSLITHLLFETSTWLFEAEQWLGILMLGIGPVGGAFYLWDIGIKHGNKTLLASLSFIAPVISSVLLVWAGVASWSNNIWIALLFILIGAGVNSIFKREIK